MFRCKKRIPKKGGKEEEWEQVLHSVKEQIVACTQVLEAGADGK